MTRSIDINLGLCKQPCQICDQVVPGIRARIEKSGPVMIRGWAWLEQGGRYVVGDWAYRENFRQIETIVTACPIGAFEGGE